jgi:hypothetical protein
MITKRKNTIKNKAVTVVAVKRKKLIRFKPQLRSRHPSHQPLRTLLGLLPFRSIVRLGSTTSSDRPDRIECNSIQGVKNSADKLKMKQCFTRAGVKTANWFTKAEGVQAFINIHEDLIDYDNLPYPIIAKHRFGSRGTGNYKLDNQQALEQWLVGKNLSNYIFEEFVKMTREYRLHITKDGCFYTCRKLVRNDAPEGTWQRHDDVCTWILETNPSFKKPANWDAIVQDCINAQQSLGLDICAFDVMVQGSKNGRERANPKWIICESCSAPSFGDITLQKYVEEIPKILTFKFRQ